MIDPSADAVIARPCAFSVGAQVVIRLPVLRLYASTFARAVSLVPAAAPAGRAEVNLPVAYTVLPTTTWSQTTPLICTVGSESAETVAGVPLDVGAVSAPAGAAASTEVPSTAAATTTHALTVHERVDDVVVAIRSPSRPPEDASAVDCRPRS